MHFCLAVKRQIRSCESRRANFDVEIVIDGIARPPKSALNTGFFGGSTFIPLKCDCIKNGVFIDDGFSGTSFDRPDFQRMIGDIESGKINLVIVKDLSRLGRNYILCGQYTEIYFPEKNVRFIALNDGIDTLYSNNDIAPFKNILNDMYAKDISVKVKSSLHAKARRGEFLGPNPPYGYLRDPDDKYHLVVNHEVAPNIIRMFELVVAGYGLARIAKILTADGILTPSDYTASKNCNSVDEFQPRYKWSMYIVRCIVQNQMYLGHMVQCRKRSQSYRTHKIVRNEKEDWIIVEDTHEPIVTEELFTQAQKAMTGRTRIIKRRDEPNLFSGLFFCAECGRTMAHHDRKDYHEYFSCGKYRSEGKNSCSSHFIRLDEITQIVLQNIRANVQLLQEDEEKAIQRIVAKKCVDEEKRLLTAARELAKQKKRQSEIDSRIKRVYEDNVSGKLPNELFHTFLRDYESEREGLKKSIHTLEEAVRELESNRTDISQFVKLIKQYSGITELTRPALMALINRITISEPKSAKGKRGHNQTIEINYKFVGAL